MTTNNATNKVKAADTDFAAIVNGISKQKLTARIKQLSDGFNNRMAFENTVAPANTAIQLKLKNYGAKITSSAIAALTIATNVDPDFMNKTNANEAKRFNVYAIDKMADLLKALNTGVLQNAVNKAIVESMFKMEAAGEAFTGVHAQASVSDKIKVEPASTAKMLTRHTASASTAPTQSSSTMAALHQIGVVVNIGSVKAPVWKLTESPQTARLRDVAQGKAQPIAKPDAEATKQAIAA